MITRNGSLLILFTFGLSLFLFPLLEAGHEVLHHIENEFHHHDADPHHTLADHHLQEHHDDEEMDEDGVGSSLISLLFGFVNPPTTPSSTFLFSVQTLTTACVSGYISIAHCPPTPPPLT